MVDETERKQITLELKDGDDEGFVVAVFATLNVVDLDGDVTIPGAFGNQEVRLSAWGHQWGSLPVGRGSIHEKDDKAIFEGQFFLDTTDGLDTYRTVKNLGTLQEWSYGFRVLDSGEGQFDNRPVRLLKKLKVDEVSPVMIGAGVETHTVTIKGKGEMLGDHADRVLADVAALLERMKAVSSLRAEDGRNLSDAHLDRLARLKAQLDQLIETAASPADNSDAQKLFLEYQRTLVRLAGSA